MCLGFQDLHYSLNLFGFLDNFSFVNIFVSAIIVMFAYLSDFPLLPPCLAAGQVAIYGFV